MRVLQIIPRMPPESCGVGDYASVLGMVLARDHDIRSRFLVPTATMTAPLPSADRISTAPRSAVEFAQTLDALRPEFDAIVLQFSVYGYHGRGTPLWLVAGLRRFLREHPRVAVHTMFHELYATGPPTSSAFWLSPLQKLILRQVAELSRTVRTNRNAYGKWLSEAGRWKSAPIPVFPVFSNLGEQHPPMHYDQRSLSMTLFSAGIRGAVDWESLSAVVDSCGITKIHHIGANLKISPPPALHRNMEIHGHLPADGVSALLQQSRLGYLDYYDGYLGKSGIFAAYSAHGVPVLMKEVNHSELDGLHAGIHYGVAGSTSLLPQPLAKMSKEVAEWYAPHNQQATAQSYALDLNRP